MPLLDTIQSPADLKPLNAEQRRQLAAEIRQVILKTVSSNGGHLATNLGSVELSLALHTVYDSPSDKIVLDTGHQGYTHKLVTGRAARFGTLRQKGGLSGFLKRDESEHDAFGAGHAATSISAAAGMAAARDLLKTREHVVCVIGDSSIPNGMAFEALNDLGQRKTDILVVLNDNEMSISRPVGALSKYLSRIITGRTYNGMRERWEQFAKGLPHIGAQVAKLSHHAEEFVKSVFSPGVFFEELGFTYVGPVDGHDCEATIEILKRIKATLHGPVLLHAVTRKGKGFGPAEKDPICFHGAKGFDVVTGALPAAQPGALPSWSGAFSAMLLEAAKQDPRVAVITPAMIEGSSLQAFEREIPTRLFDVGIAEEHAVTLAAGMATRGLRPVVVIYSTFFQRGFDQAVHDVAQQKLPVTFVFDRSGLVGDDGPTHHGVLDIAILRPVPNMVLMAPSDATEMRRMLATGLALEGPSAIRMPRGGVIAGSGGVLDEPLDVGQGRVLREGSDACVVAYGLCVGEALKAAEHLAADGLSLRVVDARFAKPLDGGLMEDCARRFDVLLTAEDGVVAGGFGTAVLEHLAGLGLVPAQFARLGVPDEFVEHGTPEQLRAQCGYDAAGIAAKARALVGKAKFRAA